MKPLHTLGSATLFAMVLCVVTGCGQKDSATTRWAHEGVGAALLAPRPNSATESQNEPNGLAYYPLRIGNHWHYAVTIRRTWLPTSSIPDSVMVFHRTRARDLVCSETLSGREYLVEQQTEWRPEIPPSILWAGIRQDRSGLYQAFPFLSGAPPCLGPVLLTTRFSPGRSTQSESPGALGIADLLDSGRRTSTGGDLTTETVLLQYPLNTGAEWAMNGGTRIRVEGVDVLNLPAGRFVAHRLGVQARWMGPGDNFHIWYGRTGYLASQLHFLHYPELGPPDFWIDQSEVLDTLALRN